MNQQLITPLSDTWCVNLPYIPRWLLVFPALGFIVLIGIFLAGFSFPPDDQSVRPSVLLLYTSSGTVLQLLETGQIDGFFIWEPTPHIASLGGVGKIIATEEDLPPDHLWRDEPCCVLVMHQNIIDNHQEVAALLSALTTAGIDYIREHRDPAVNETALWLYGKNHIIIGDADLDPMAVERASFPELDYISGEQALSSPNTTNSVILQGLAILNRSVKVTELSHPVEIAWAYLPTDHHAPLFILLNNWKYFMDRYGIALVPTDNGEGRHSEASLIAGDQVCAHVKLLPGQNGGGLMTGIGQGVFDAAYVGSVPAKAQISLGNPARIIQPLHSGGSSLVVGLKAPCTDWQSFTRWARDRSSLGKPLIIATVQTSIQENMLRRAFTEEEIDVRLLEL